MEILHPCCAGLDVHKKTVVACVSRITDEGEVLQQSRRFGTVTAELLALGDWLAAQGVTHVAMESTGVYWKPVFHILEGHFELMRKSGLSDCRGSASAPSRLPPSLPGRCPSRVGA